MARRKRLPFWRKAARRFRTGYKDGIKVAGGTGTIIAMGIGVVSATGVDFAFWQVGVGVALSAAAGVISAWVAGTESLLPAAICNDAHDDGRYRAEFCTEGQLREANEWTIPVYGAESISSDLAIQWLLKNPKGFVAIVNDRGELCASFGMIGLSDSCVELHMRGEILDSDLKTTDVLSFAQAKASDRLYISGVVVRNHGSPAGNRRAAVMIWAMLMYVKRLLGLKTPRQLYTIAVTKDAKRLLVNYGFTLHTPGSQRRDGCDLFVFSLNEASWKSTLARIGDLTPMCTLKLSGTRKG